MSSSRSLPAPRAPTGWIESAAIRAALFVAGIVLASLGILELRLRSVHYLMITRRAVDEATIPSPLSARLLALGHTEWVADILWTRALLYFGDSIATRSGQRYLQRYADAIEDIDPPFRQAYLWAATVSIYNGRPIHRESVLTAIHNLERGLRVFPDDAEMIHQLGFDLFFEFPRFAENDAERLAFRRRGAEYLRRAAALGYGPPWMALAAGEALLRTGLTDRAVEHLRDLYLRTDDPVIRARIQTQIEIIARERGTEDPFLDAIHAFDAERRGSFPYVSSALYLFVGPPVPGVASARTPPASSGRD